MALARGEEPESTRHAACSRSASGTRFVLPARVAKLASKQTLTRLPAVPKDSGRVPDVFSEPTPPGSPHITYTRPN